MKRVARRAGDRLSASSLARFRRGVMLTRIACRQVTLDPAQTRENGMLMQGTRVRDGANEASEGSNANEGGNAKKRRKWEKGSGLVSTRTRM